MGLRTVGVQRKPALSSYSAMAFINEIILFWLAAKLCLIYSTCTCESILPHFDCQHWLGGRHARDREVLPLRGDVQASLPQVQGGLLLLEGTLHGASPEGVLLPV